MAAMDMPGMMQMKEKEMNRNEYGQHAHGSFHARKDDAKDAMKKMDKDMPGWI